MNNHHLPYFLMFVELSTEQQAAAVAIVIVVAVRHFELGAIAAAQFVAVPNEPKRKLNKDIYKTFTESLLSETDYHWKDKIIKT